MVDPYNAILFSHRNEWGTDTCYHMNGSCKWYTKWKKVDTKSHIVYDSVYVRYPG